MGNTIKSQSQKLLKSIILLAGLGFSLTGFTFQVDMSDYEVYIGDFNDDGNNSDIYLHEKSTLILLHGSIVTPIEVPGSNGLVFYNGGFHRFFNLQIDKNQLSNYSLAEEGVDYNVYDENGDGYADLFSYFQEDEEVKFAFEENSEISAPPAPILATPPSIPASFDSHKVLPGTFDVNTSGQATYSIPIQRAPSGGGFGPNISLEYNSGSGNGLAGYGWSLGGLGKITRCRQTNSQDGRARPITWNTQDRFCLNGARLLVETGSYGAPGSTYRTEIDRHLKVTAQGGSTGHPDHFVVEYKNGIIEVYDVKHRVSNGSSTQLYAWYLGKKEDSAGNKMSYSYHNPGNGAIPRIRVIYYAYDREEDEPSSTTEFSWEERPDPISGYVSGYYYENQYRLRDVYTNGSSGVKYQLHYSEEDGYYGYYEDNLSRLVEVSHCVRSHCGRPTRFEWPIPSDSNLRTDIETERSLTYLNVSQPQYALGDLSGNGLPDIVWGGAGTVRTAFASVSSTGQVNYTVRSVVGGSISVKPHVRFQLIDYDGDGRMDLATRPTNASGAVGDMKVFLSRPQTNGTWALETAGAVTLDAGTNGTYWTLSSFVDINADGLVDTVDLRNKRVMTQQSGSFGSYHPQRNIVFNHQGAPSGLTVGDLLPAVGDFNGDGTIDFLVDTSAGYAAYASEPGTSGYLTLKYLGLATQSMNISGTDNYHVRAVDLNGDGLSDIAYEDGGMIKYRLSKGGGGFTPVKTLSMQTQWKYTTFVDRNADGYPDAVDLIGNPAPSSMYLSTRYWDPETNAFRTYSTNTSLPFTGFPETYSLRDANGDGAPDVITELGGSQVGIRVIPGGRSAEGNRITGIRKTDNLEADIEIAYENLGQSTHYSFVNKVASSTSQQVCQSTLAGNSCWNRGVAASSRSALSSQESNPFSGLSSHDQIIESTPFHRVFNVNSSMPVVTQVSRRLSGGLATTPGYVSVAMTPVTSYYYEQGQMQASGRGFLGFKKLVEVDRRTGLRKATSFRRDWPFTGRPVKSEVFTRSGTLLNKTDMAWALADCNATCLSALRSSIQSGGTASAAAIEPFQKRADARTYDLNGAGLFGRTVTTRTMDDHGNTLTETENTYDGIGALVLQKSTNDTHTLFSTGSYSMKQGRLTNRVVTHTSNGESITREAAFGYYSTGPEAGLLKKETVEPNQPAFKVETEHFYDAFGNRTQSKVTAGGVTRYGERTEYGYLGRYPSKVYDYLTSGTETGETEYLKTYFISRDKFGTPLHIRRYTSSSNYVTERVGTTRLGQVYFQSDSTGRRTDITLGTSHSYCPSGNKTYRYELAVEQGGTSTLACYDLQGRVIRTGQKMLSGSWSGVDREYDKAGRLAHESRPAWLSSSARYWTTTQYDALERPTDVQNPDGSNLQIAYSGGWKHATNELGQTRSEQKNPLGQVVHTIGELPGTDITYEYDPRGNLKSMTGPAGTTTLEYDLLDRKESMSDPDKGTWSYQYNHFGELTCQTDAKNQKIVQRYDRRGRLYNRRDATGGSCTSPTGIQSNTTWTYDTATNGYGQLSLVKDVTSNYEQQLYYDTFGRVRQTRTRLPGVNNQLGNHYEKITYNQYGQVFQVFDAARNGTNYTDNAIQYTYKNGHMEKVIDAVHVGGQTRKTYYDARTMDAAGQVTHAIYGNGVTQRATYNPQTGRLTNLRAQNSMNQYLQYQDLIWDDVGNLEERTETGIGSGIGARDLTETYDYDGMNRLESWTSSGVFNGTESYQYDAKDNLTYKTGLGTYKYGSQCASSYNAGPHAVCQAGGSTYSYDNNGNQISGGGRSTTYSVFDKPLTITKGSHTTGFSYGPDRSRYKRTDTNGSDTTTTLYLGNVEKIHYPNNTVQWKRTIAGGVAVLTQTFNSSGTETNADLHYLIKDHLGTLSLITDGIGGVTHELYSDPWGQPRKPVWNGSLEYYTPGLDTPYLKQTSTVTQRGFTGHEHLDEVGVVHMNGRVYDPRLARFMQADPIIQDPTTPRSLNRFSYVWNNPLNATDPSGYLTEQQMDDAEEEARRKAQKHAERKARFEMFNGMAAVSSGRYDIALDGVSFNSYSGSSASFEALVGNALQWTVVNSLVGSSGSCGGDSCLTTGRVVSVTIRYSTPIRIQANAPEERSWWTKNVVEPWAREVMGLDTTKYNGNYWTEEELQLITFLGAGGGGFPGSLNLAVVGSSVSRAASATEQLSLRGVNGFTTHGALRASGERGFNLSRILRVVRDGNVTQATGRYGTIQNRYSLGGNTVVVETEGRNAGKIITTFSDDTANGGYWVTP